MPEGQNTKPRILLVEDEQDNRETLRLLLTAQGYDVMLAQDGFEALACLDQARPDVAVVDIGLPGMDGYEVAKRIRETPLGHDILMIALTGYGQRSDRISAKQAGFDEHLVKPLRINLLRRILDQHFG